MSVQITRDDSAAAARAAAVIWTGATARRDQRPTPAPAEEKLPGILRALAIPGASLHLASREGEPVGFALLVPTGDVLELRYLAAAPEAWGCGVAAALLAHVADHARCGSHSRLDLWVLEDNRRAIAAYERAGWRRTPDRKSQVDTRRTECRLELVEPGSHQAMTSSLDIASDDKDP